MVYRIKKIKRKYRFVGNDGKVLKDEDGLALDNGGFITYTEAAARNKVLADAMEVPHESRLDG